MNCRGFQDRIFEYVEGTLCGRAKATAEQHLGQCEGCRRALRRHRELAQSLSGQLRERAGAVALSPAARERILGALERESARRVEASLAGLFWRRLAWPAAIAGSLLAVACLVFELQHSRGGARPELAGAHAMSIEMAYLVPVHVFRREGNAIVDVLAFQTNTVRQVLCADANSKLLSK